jgi:putative membrane protein
MLEQFRKIYLGYVRAPVAGRVWFLVVLLTAYSAGICYYEQSILHEIIKIHPDLHRMLGTVLGLFLVFRTNTAYDRWWEGRKLWGQLVNDSRNLSIKVRSIDGVDAIEASQVGRLLVNFARGLKEHLREGIRAQQLSVYKTITAEPRHIPANIAGMIRDRITRWKTEGKIDGFIHMELDVHARALMDICGACERIRRTPLARSYLAFIRQSIAIYLLTLPWSLVESLGLWTIPGMAMISYFMVGIEMIAEEVGEPFGREADDIQLDVICQGIESSVTEILGGKTDPRDLAAERGHVADIPSNPAGS